MKFFYFFLFLPLTLFSEFTQQDLENSMKYYFKISQEKNLDNNEKLAILYRIKNKYKNSGLDLSVVEKEIKKNAKSLNESEKKEKTEQSQPQQEIKKTDYIIEIGDIISVIISPAEELSRDVIVNPDGTITFPFVGVIAAKGLTLENLKNILTEKMSKYVTNPQVSLSVKYFSRKQVFLTGEVHSPGNYPYRENMRLLELISKGGGFTETANTTKIRIHRGEGSERRVIIFNAEEIIKTANFTKDFVLEPGDIVEVSKGYKVISVIGAVRLGGNFAWKENLKVLEALSLAGGPSIGEANLSSVKIIRSSKEGERIIEVNLNKALKGDLKENILLEPGDIVFVSRSALVSGSWFVSNILPWLNLILLILVLRGSLGL